jgi:hypothetical protein
MFKLRCEVRGYLTFEIIAKSSDKVMELFEAAVRARCKNITEDEVRAEIEGIKPSWITEVVEGIEIDGETFYL